MSFSPAFLDELRARLPLSDIVGKRLRLIRAGREFKGCCPFHNEKTPSFYINDDKQFYHCFGCGAHGDVIGFTMRFDHLSFPEAIESLAAQAGLAVPRDAPVERAKYDQEKRLYQLLERTTAWFEEQLYAPAGREALAYLRGRGLGQEALRRFHLGYAPQDSQALLRALRGEGFQLEELLAVGLAKKAEERGDHYSFFRHRVMFPVGDRRGRTVAFGGRVLGEGEPKYLNSPDHPLFHKGQLLYGLSRARAALAQGQEILVVEGYMDVIALAEAGFQGAVRCFDGEKAGVRAAARAVERALPLLASSRSIRVAYLPGGEDPDSLLKQSGKSALQSVLAQAKPMVDVIWDLTLEGRRLQTPEDRGGFMSALRQRVSRIQDETLRALYQDEVQKRLATAFRWQKPNTGEGGFSRGQKIKKEPFSSSLPRKQPMKAQQLREKVLLALILNHPALFSEVGDDFSRIAFLSPHFESLRQQIVNILTSDSHETLDAPELYRHLSQGEETGVWRKGLTEALSEATFMHAGFARSDRSLAQARQGWKSIWNKYLQESLQADLQTARRLYAEEASDANLNRLMALRAHLEALTRESDTQEPEDNPFGSSLLSSRE